MTERQLLASWKKGDTVDIGLSSASLDKRIAEDFANLKKGEQRSLLMEFQNSQGLPIQQMSDFPDEVEILIGGRFEIVSTKVQFQPGGGNFVKVILRQVERLPTQIV